MNGNLVKGYFLVICSGLTLFAGIALLILQWGSGADFSLYGKGVRVNTMVLMLASAAGGIVMAFLCKALVRGVKSLRKGHEQQAIKQVTEQARQQK